MPATKLSALLELAATPATDDELYIRDVSEIAADESKRITVNNVSSFYDARTATMTNKTLTSPVIGTQLTFDQTTADYTLTWANPGAARAISIPDPGGTDVFVFRDMTQTLAGKTLTTPTIAATGWTNANHAHAAANSGGQVGAADLSGTTLAAGVTASSLTSVGALTSLTITGLIDVDNRLRFDTGVAVTAGEYAVQRDADVTNQLHFNVPTGAGYEWSVNDVAEMLLSATNLTPGANDGNALGSATVSWADLFLASGGVINFNNGNLTMTHAAGVMTATGAWTFAGAATFSASGTAVQVAGGSNLAVGTNSAPQTINGLDISGSGSALGVSVTNNGRLILQGNAAEVIMNNPSGSAGLRIGYFGVSTTQFLLQALNDSLVAIDTMFGYTYSTRILLMGPLSMSFLTNVAKLGGTATRATTEGTNHHDIFDGTAPVGTLTNGISLYSTAGELRVMDSGGTATLLSPHDEDGYWVFDSVDINGKRLKIHMERFMRKLEEHFGWGLIEEMNNA